MWLGEGETPGRRHCKEVVPKQPGAQAVSNTQNYVTGQIRWNP